MKNIAHYHLPGLFEFYELYRVFLPIYKAHRVFFYDWCDIGSIYGAPEGYIWGGGRVGLGDQNPQDVLSLVGGNGISPRLTFSNSLLREEHLADKKCNTICDLFHSYKGVSSGIVIHSDLLLKYLRERYPNFYFISSTTKVLTDFSLFDAELNRDEFDFVVPDFRLNNQLEKLSSLTEEQRAKVEFLINECCYFGCQDRRICYENVSRKILGEDCPDHVCRAPGGSEGYKFSKAMKNPGFIGVEDIRDTYLSMGFSNFKIEGRGLGSAMVLEFLLYYMVKPEYQIQVREMVYLDSMLDLF